MFTASILFIYIQLLYYCRYVITIGYLSHCLGAEYIWKFKLKCSSYCEMVCEKIHYLRKELVFLIHHILLYPQKNSFSKNPNQKKMFFYYSHTQPTLEFYILADNFDIRQLLRKALLCFEVSNNTFAANERYWSLFTSSSQQ